MTTTGDRLSQPERRERTRAAVLEAAARHLSRRGYGNLNLEAVATDAGYTRGAIYHLYASKEELATAVVGWVEETWYDTVGPLLAAGDGATALRSVARAHAVFCRRDIARVMAALRIEFGGGTGADAAGGGLGAAAAAATARVVADCTHLIELGRSDGSVPPGIDATTLALAVVFGVEGLVIGLSGRVPDDEILAQRTVEGLLGLPHEPPAGVGSSSLRLAVRRRPDR